MVVQARAKICRVSCEVYSRQFGWGLSEATRTRSRCHGSAVAVSPSDSLELSVTPRRINAGSKPSGAKFPLDGELVRSTMFLVIL